ncbi:hypothetical protein HYH03_018546 [Edaphochlamys debaryana]|uniref:Uncharacterized protein n=1 Tax=Edaphochlamys debaryana TaxID=47281 RepID=A0A836BPA1_9CHLO|nr:hypothetical protein HYH03_018546 [Edaphochlamys debaryana]|eukprot:KAG2482529.1 hypothetical protein HYH03_018546 [Edaphochlamys debaryana]
MEEDAHSSATNRRNPATQQGTARPLLAVDLQPPAAARPGGGHAEDIAAQALLGLSAGSSTTVCEGARVEEEAHSSPANLAPGQSTARPPRVADLQPPAAPAAASDQGGDSAGVGARTTPARQGFSPSGPQGPRAAPAEAAEASADAAGTGAAAGIARGAAAQCDQLVREGTPGQVPGAGALGGPQPHASVSAAAPDTVSAASPAPWGPGPSPPASAAVGAAAAARGGGSHTTGGADGTERAGQDQPLPPPGMGAPTETVAEASLAEAALAPAAAEAAPAVAAPAAAEAAVAARAKATAAVAPEQAGAGVSSAGADADAGEQQGPSGRTAPKQGSRPPSPGRAGPSRGASQGALAAAAAKGGPGGEGAPRGDRPPADQSDGETADSDVQMVESDGEDVDSDVQIVESDDDVRIVGSCGAHDEAAAAAGGGAGGGASPLTEGVVVLWPIGDQAEYLVTLVEELLKVLGVRTCSGDVVLWLSPSANPIDDTVDAPSAAVLGVRELVKLQYKEPGIWVGSGGGGGSFGSFVRMLLAGHLSRAGISLGQRDLYLHIWRLPGAGDMYGIRILRTNPRPRGDGDSTAAAGAAAPAPAAAAAAPAPAAAGGADGAGRGGIAQQTRAAAARRDRTAAAANGDADFAAAAAAAAAAAVPAAAGGSDGVRRSGIAKETRTAPARRDGTAAAATAAAVAALKAAPAPARRSHGAGGSGGARQTPATAAQRVQTAAAAAAAASAPAPAAVPAAAPAAVPAAVPAAGGGAGPGAGVGLAFPWSVEPQKHGCLEVARCPWPPGGRPPRLPSIPQLGVAEQPEGALGDSGNLRVAVDVCDLELVPETDGAEQAEPPKRIKATLTYDDKGAFRVWTLRPGRDRNGRFGRKRSMDELAAALGIQPGERPLLVHLRPLEAGTALRWGFRIVDGPGPAGGGGPAAGGVGGPGGAGVGGAAAPPPASGSGRGRGRGPGGRGSNGAVRGSGAGSGGRRRAARGGGARRPGSGRHAAAAAPQPGRGSSRGRGGATRGRGAKAPGKRPPDADEGEADAAEAAPPPKRAKTKQAAAGGVGAAAAAATAAAEGSLAAEPDDRFALVPYHQGGSVPRQGGRGQAGSGGSGEAEVGTGGAGRGRGGGGGRGGGRRAKAAGRAGSTPPHPAPHAEDLALQPPAAPPPPPQAAQALLLALPAGATVPAVDRLTTGHLSLWDPHQHALTPPPHEQELRVCGVVFPAGLKQAVIDAMDAWKDAHSRPEAPEAWRRVAGYRQVDVSAAPAHLRDGISESMAARLGLSGTDRGKDLPAESLTALGRGQGPSASRTQPPFAPVQLAADGPPQAAAAIELAPGDVIDVVAGHVMTARDAEGFAEEGLLGCSEDVQQALSQRGGRATSDKAWEFLVGAAQVPCPGLRVAPAPQDEPQAPGSLVLSTLGHYSLAGAVRDVEAVAAGGAERPKANCAVMPVWVRGVPLPVLVATREIGQGQRLLVDRGEEWWERLQGPRRSLEDRGDGAWVRRVLGLPEPAQGEEGQPAQGAAAQQAEGQQAAAPERGPGPEGPQGG